MRPTKALDLVYNLGDADRTASRNLKPDIEVTAMDDEDTVVLTPEEKDKILKEVPPEEKKEEEEEKD